MKRAFVLFSCVMALMFGTAEASEKKVTVEGFGAVVNGNVELAKKEATEDALRRALEMVMGAVVSAETVVENYQLVSDKIISKVNGYIKAYKVLESKEAQGVVTAKVEVTVKESDLKNDLELLQTTLERMNYPKVVVMMAEQNVGATVFSFWWGGATAQTMQSDIGAAEQALTAALLEKNFRIVDRNTLATGAKVKPAFQVVDISNQDVLQLTKGIDADIVIVGKAMARSLGSIAGSTMTSNQANVTMRAINLKDGKVLGSSAGQAAQAHIDPVTGGTMAIDKAAKNASQKLVTDMVKSWTQTLNNGEEFTLVVGKLPDSVAMFKAEQAVRANKLVTGVVVQSFAGGTATFRVMFRGDANGLAQSLGDKFKATGIDGKKVVVEPK
ncbi:MAG TPA: hypothetical protein P5077_08050 [bacterium]|nr:hypothetical protein [bacterium]